MMIHCNSWYLPFFVLQQQQNLGQRFGTSKMHLSPPPTHVDKAAFRSKAVVLLLLIVTPIMEFCNCSMFYCVHSSFAITLMGKSELVALLSLSSWCLVIVVLFFLPMPWVCLQFLIMVFPDHTHYYFFSGKRVQMFIKGFNLQNCFKYPHENEIIWSQGRFW